jgi:hypothetical protein
MARGEQRVDGRPWYANHYVYLNNAENTDTSTYTIASNGTNNSDVIFYYHNIVDVVVLQYEVFDAKMDGGLRISNLAPLISTCSATSRTPPNCTPAPLLFLLLQLLHGLLGMPQPLNKLRDADIVRVEPK